MERNAKRKKAGSPPHFPMCDIDVVEKDWHKPPKNVPDANKRSTSFGRRALRVRPGFSTVVPFGRKVIESGESSITCIARDIGSPRWPL